MLPGVVAVQLKAAGLLLLRDGETRQQPLSLAKRNSRRANPPRIASLDAPDRNFAIKIGVDARAVIARSEYQLAKRLGPRKFLGSAARKQEVIVDQDEHGVA